MPANILLISITFLIFYEILPETLCIADGNELNHFAGIIKCNTLLENSLLSLSLVIFIIFYLCIKSTNNKESERKKIENQKLVILSNSLTIITLLSTVALWRLTNYSLVPDPSARSTLVIKYHQIYGNPIVSPFLYLSIIISSFLSIKYNKHKQMIFNIALLTFGCYITMSRGFILSALLPYLATRKPKQILKYAPILIILFFLRDILNNSIDSYFTPNHDSIQAMLDAFGEFTNTYFGRRYFISNHLTPDYNSYLTENLLKLTGIYYILIPIFKVLAYINIPTPSSTLEINNAIEHSLGLTGFAGSYLSDLTIFYPFSLILIFFTASILAVLYKKLLNTNERIIFCLISSMLIPNAFRWSLTSYLTSLCGLTVFYIFFYKFLLRISKMSYQKNYGAQSNI